MLDLRRLSRIDRLRITVLDDVANDYAELAVAVDRVILRRFAPTAIEQDRAGRNARAVIWTFSCNRAERSNC